MSAPIGGTGEFKDNGGGLAIPRRPDIPPPSQEPAPVGPALDAIVNGTPAVQAAVAVPTAGAPSTLQTPPAVMQTPQVAAQPTVPRGTPAPVPQAAAPVPPPPAAAQYVADGMMMKATVNGKTIDVPIADVRASFQMRSAAEETFRRAGAQRAELAGLTREVEIGRVVLAHQNNPEVLSQRLAELTGKPLVVNTKEAEDDGLDPQTRALKAQIATLEARQARTDQFFAGQAVDETMRSIHTELDKYPGYQQDPRLRGRAELVVAAVVSQDRAKGLTTDIAQVIGELHAEDSAILIERTTNQRDQRAADIQNHASVPPSAGTPALTTNEPAKIAGEEWQKGTGAFGRGWRQLINP